MFYLKYRPQTLDQIDSLLVRDRVKTILATDVKFPFHAILLSGPKGTGKTSTARIIAKSINCLNNFFSGAKARGIEPCNQCANCISITKGSSIDVVEMDGASSRKIDDIRELLSKIKFASILTRFKVYIIDEIHMLTKEAFNALLKSLEEPPQSTIFILATTEYDQLPKTIISRCIDIKFHRPAKDDIERALLRIVKSEKIKISSEAISVISSACDDSFRDAVKMLEEALSKSASAQIEKKTILDIIGLGSEHAEILQSIARADLPATFKITDSFEKKGGNFKVLIENILDCLHLLLLKKNGIKTPLDEDYDLNTRQIAKLLKLLQEAHKMQKFTPIDSLPIEIAVCEYFDVK